MITSFYPGRVRLRAPVFKDEELCSRARSILSSSDAVTNVEHNLVTGSILLEYDTDKVPMDKLLPMQNFFMKLAKEAMRFDEHNRTKIIEMLNELENIVKSW